MPHRSDITTNLYHILALLFFFGDPFVKEIEEKSGEQRVRPSPSHFVIASVHTPTA
jgi:hypothetical protein